jgi:uncharacterized damage-inducible protein DinB
MLNRDALRTLDDYNTYANNLVLDSAAQLSEADLSAEASPSHGSIRRLLLHMLAVEAGYLASCQARIVERSDLASLPDIRRYWGEVTQRRRTYLDQLDEAELARAATITLGRQELRFPVWQMLLQAFTHSAHHRGELALLLGQRGHAPPTLDVIVYFARQSGQPWPSGD